MKTIAFLKTSLSSVQRHRQVRRSRRRGGSVIVLVTLSTVFLLGCTALAVDYGLLVVDANRLQRACDAAALAGASQLKMTNDTTDTYNAKVVAVNTAAQNGVVIDHNRITFLENNTQIK